MYDGLDEKLINICMGIICPGNSCPLSIHTLYINFYYINFDQLLKVNFWPIVFEQKLDELNIRTTRNLLSRDNLRLINLDLGLVPFYIDKLCLALFGQIS